MNKGGYERKRIDDYCELGKNGRSAARGGQRDAAPHAAKKSMIEKKRKFPRQGLRETYKKGHGSVTLHPLAQRKV